MSITLISQLYNGMTDLWKKLNDDTSILEVSSYEKPLGISNTLSVMLLTLRVTLSPLMTYFLDFTKLTNFITFALPQEIYIIFSEYPCRFYCHQWCIITAVPVFINLKWFVIMWRCTPFSFTVSWEGESWVYIPYKHNSRKLNWYSCEGWFPLVVCCCQTLFLTEMKRLK